MAVVRYSRATASRALRARPDDHPDSGPDPLEAERSSTSSTNACGERERAVTVRHHLHGEHEQHADAAPVDAARAEHHRVAAWPRARRRRAGTPRRRGPSPRRHRRRSSTGPRTASRSGECRCCTAAITVAGGATAPGTGRTFRDRAVTERRSPRGRRRGSRSGGSVRRCSASTCGRSRRWRFCFSISRARRWSWR